MSFILSSSHYPQWDRQGLLRRERLFSKVQVVAEPLASHDLLNCQGREAICQGQEEVAATSSDGQDDTASNPAPLQALAGKTLTGSDVLLGVVFLIVVAVCGENKLDQSASHQAGSKVSREVVVQEELASHEEEWHVVGCPSQPEETGRVVQARAGAYRKLEIVDKFGHMQAYGERVHPRRGGAKPGQPQ